MKVSIPTALRQFANGQDTVELTGRDIGEVLDQLTSQHPQLKKHLFTDDGQLRNFVNVFVNEDNIRDREKLKTPLADNDEVTIVPAVAGGVAPVFEPNGHWQSAANRQ